MYINISKNEEKMGQKASEKASSILSNAIKEKGKAVFVAATGASQFEFLKYLTVDKSIDWSKSTMFHLDEYVGLDSNHTASFRRYLNERIIKKVNPGQVYFIQGDHPKPEEECGRLSKIIQNYEIDVAFVGIGENSHLAFNDPPADFNTKNAFMIVQLDEACRQQQVNEGWFDRLEDVPAKAITMSIPQIMKARNIICVVPDQRKALAVKNSLEREISPSYPASILRKHQNLSLFLDKDSASLIKT